MATPETEIRKLQPIELCTLAQILNQADAWKTLMAIIPKPEDPQQCLFHHEHFTMIEQAIRQQQRNGAEIFLSEWSTLGRHRPTCRTMLDLLVKAELFRAADYLAVGVLKGNAPERPKFGPAAAIDVSDKALEELLKQQAADLQNDSDISEHPSKEPMSWSMHFVEKPVNVMAATCQSEKAKDQQEFSDLIKFSDTVKSDLIKFSDSKVDGVEELPQQVSSIVKISDNGVAKEHTEKSDNYVLQEARSEDIPLCVRENAFQINDKMMSTITNQETETATTIDSSDVSESIIASEEVDLPSVSQNVIPVVVLEYNEKDQSGTV